MKVQECSLKRKKKKKKKKDQAEDTISAKIILVAEKEAREKRAEKMLKDFKVLTFEQPKRRKIIHMVVRIGDYLKTYRNGSIQLYVHNRGSNGILNKPQKNVRETINKVRDNFMPMLLDSIRLQVDKDGIATISEGHQRSKGTNDRLEEGMMTTEELNAMVVLILGNIDDFLETYVGVNDRKSHSPSERVLNPDLFVGDTIQTLLTFGAESLNNKLSAKHFYNIMYVLMEYEEGNGSLRPYWGIFNSRKDSTRELSTISKDDPKRPKISDAAFQAVAPAFDFYLQWKGFMKQALKEDKTDARERLRTIIGSAPFCGLILLDFLSPGKRLIGERGPKVFASRCIRNKMNLGRMVPGITHGSSQIMQENIAEIYDVYK